MMLVVDISLAEPGMELLRDVKDSKGNLLAKNELRFILAE